MKVSEVDHVYIQPVSDVSLPEGNPADVKEHALELTRTLEVS